VLAYGTITFDVVLPADSVHTYQLAAGEAAQVLAVTYPVQSTPDGWNGFVADMEQANS
jgi:hypothetical protein